MSPFHLWIIARYPRVAKKWSTLPDLLYVGVFPLLALLAFIMLFQSLRRHREFAPLLWNAAIVLFSFIGLSVGLYPDMIPDVISQPVTVKQAAASPKTFLREGELRGVWTRQRVTNAFAKPVGHLSLSSA